LRLLVQTGGLQKTDPGLYRWIEYGCHATKRTGYHFAANFNASSVDDCTPAAQLVFSFSGNTFQPSMTYTCDNVPAIGVPFDIEMWAADGGVDANCNGIIEWSERNKDFCTASLIIQDPNNICDELGWSW
jgi:hypothetical protein